MPTPNSSNDRGRLVLPVLRLDDQNVGQFNFCKNFDFFVFIIDLVFVCRLRPNSTSVSVCGHLRPLFYF